MVAASPLSRCSLQWRKDTEMLRAWKNAMDQPVALLGICRHCQFDHAFFTGKYSFTSQYIIELFKFCL
jgi:hypothetical protein